MQHNGRRLITPAFALGYRAAMTHARRSLKLVEQDLRLEHAQMREEIEALQAQLIELRQMAGVPDPDQPLN